MSSKEDIKYSLQINDITVHNPNLDKALSFIGNNPLEESIITCPLFSDNHDKYPRKEEFISNNKEEDYKHWKLFNLSHIKSGKKYKSITINLTKVEIALPNNKFFKTYINKPFCDAMNDYLQNEYTSEHNSFQKLIAHFQQDGYLFLLFQEGGVKIINELRKLQNNFSVCYTSFHLICATKYFLDTSANSKRKVLYNFLLPDNLYFYNPCSKVACGGKKRVSRDSINTELSNLSGVKPSPSSKDYKCGEKKRILLGDKYLFSFLDNKFTKVEFYESFLSCTNVTIENSLCYESPNRIEYIKEKTKKKLNSSYSIDSGYLLPEITEADCVWTFGIILYVFTFKDLPFKNKKLEARKHSKTINKRLLSNTKNFNVLETNFENYHENILSSQYNFPDDIDQSLKSLLERIFINDPKERITLKEIFTDKYFISSLSLNEINVKGLVDFYELQQDDLAYIPEPINISAERRKSSYIQDSNKSKFFNIEKIRFNDQQQASLLLLHNTSSIIPATANKNYGLRASKSGEIPDKHFSFDGSGDGGKSLFIKKPTKEIKEEPIKKFNYLSKGSNIGLNFQKQPSSSVNYQILSSIQLNENKFNQAFNQASPYTFNFLNNHAISGFNRRQTKEIEEKEEVNQSSTKPINTFNNQNTFGTGDDLSTNSDRSFYNNNKEKDSIPLKIEVNHDIKKSKELSENLKILYENLLDKYEELKKTSDEWKRKYDNLLKENEILVSSNKSRFEEIKDLTEKKSELSSTIRVLEGSLYKEKRINEENTQKLELLNNRNKEAMAKYSEAILIKDKELRLKEERLNMILKSDIGLEDTQSNSSTTINLSQNSNLSEKSVKILKQYFEEFKQLVNSLISKSETLNAKASNEIKAYIDKENAKNLEQINVIKNFLDQTYANFTNKEKFSFGQDKMKNPDHSEYYTKEIHRLNNIINTNKFAAERLKIQEERNENIKGLNEIKSKEIDKLNTLLNEKNNLINRNDKILHWLEARFSEAKDFIINNEHLYDKEKYSLFFEKLTCQYIESD